LTSKWLLTFRCSKCSEPRLFDSSHSRLQLQTAKKRKYDEEEEEELVAPELPHDKEELHKRAIETRNNTQDAITELQVSSIVSLSTHPLSTGLLSWE